MTTDLNELPGMLALAVATAEQQWPCTMDAQVWADKWMERVTRHPEIATDRETMIGWFANAIMAGYDTANSRLRRERRTREGA